MSTLFSRHDPDGSVFYFAAEDFEGLRRIPYSFKNKRGDTLNGAFYSYGNPDSDKLIIFEHGMGAGHRAYLREIEMLCRRGVLVFSYDHTGCASSGGEHIYGFLGSISDLDDCIKALRADENYKNREISVVGHSWGAFSTLNIPAIHKDVKNIVAISGFVSVSEMQRQVIPFILAPYRKTVFELEAKTNPEYIHHSAIDTLLNSDVNALIIHSKDDKTVSIRHFYNMKKALMGKENVKFLLLDGKNHNPTYKNNAVKYKNAFFKTLKQKRKANLLSTDEAKSEFVKSYDWHKMTEQDEAVWAEIYKALEI